MKHSRYWHKDRISQFQEKLYNNNNETNYLQHAKYEKPNITNFEKELHSSHPTTTTTTTTTNTTGASVKLDRFRSQSRKKWIRSVARPPMQKLKIDLTLFDTKKTSFEKSISLKVDPKNCPMGSTFNEGSANWSLFQHCNVGAREALVFPPLGKSRALIDFFVWTWIFFNGEYTTCRPFWHGF